MQINPPRKTFQLDKAAQPVGRLGLSPLAIPTDPGEKIFLAGPWCLNSHTADVLLRAGVNYEVIKARVLSKEEFIGESELCLALYNKYVRVLSRELNRLHNTNFSDRYWSTLLNRFLYPLIASVMDKVFLLKRIAENNSNLVADVVDYKDAWVNPHVIPGFGGSRIMHFLLFSIVAGKTGILPCRILDSADVRQTLDRMGDGKKDLKSKKDAELSPTQSLFRFFKKRLKWLSLFRRGLKGELPLWMSRFSKSSVLALGDQYLPQAALKKLLLEAGGGSYWYNPQEWDIGEFSSTNEKLREKLNFSLEEPGLEESPLDIALQECLRRLLPTIYLENFEKARRKVEQVMPKRKAVILNSQNWGGREFVDFFIAQSVEEHESHHMMICHGGCFGAMEISVQDQIWAQISDSYALWSNAKSYGAGCEFLKMPSLRFHKWQGFSLTKPLGEDILMFLTGHYPNRYAYNSIFPYTIDDTYDQWQIRFLSALSEKNRKSLQIRDYHRSMNISQSNVQAWAEEKGIRVSASQPMAEALRQSKIAVQTVPQTTYLETISADHPTLCFWNPEANMIRADLQPFYDELIGAGVLHLSPESAAQQLNEVADDPLSWWHSPKVRKALNSFRENVCLTSPDAIDQWAKFISQKI